MTGRAVLVGALLSVAGHGGELAPVAGDALCVTRGRVAAARAQLSVDEPKLRAVVPASDGNRAELRFVYRGPTTQTALLGSGALRRQLGLKLRAQDGCNLVYVMWRIEPVPGVVVSVKRNSAARTHAECGNRGYRNLRRAGGDELQRHRRRRVARWSPASAPDILAMVSDAPQRYDLLDRIAAGGMGEVFVGRARGEHGFQKPVAIKRILPELAQNPDFVVRFVAEAKLAVSLSHANVVQVFDLGRVGDELLLVMEYVRGSDLAQLLARLPARGERPPVNIAVYIAMEALKGLVYAHERRELDGRVGIVHCDLSPSNLLLSFAGEVKIGDFGVAQALDVPRTKGAAGGVMGKVRYLAPEQLLGEAVDARTDLYALGVVLHEALTLERPFGDGELDAIATAVVRGTHPPVSHFRPDVTPELDRLVQKAMSRDPSQRPASAREMLAELARIAQ
ncbi:MAG: serine/threonine protein kinase, partial [Myxococcales bacterium]|nr:serine/threonine protein kinase [Myxococcales bacterium]